MLTLYVNSDNTVKLTGLTHAKTGLPVTTATVTFSLLDASGSDNGPGSVVSGASGLSMTYDGTTTPPGYFGTLPSSVVLTVDGRYWLQMDIANSPDDVQPMIACQAKRLGATCRV